MLFEFVKTPYAAALSEESARLIWQTPLLGITMVFAVLAILWGVLAIFQKVFDKTPAPNKQPKAEKSAPAAQPAAEPATAPVVAKNDDAELVAVITAAVAAYMQSEGDPAPDGSFRVVSFKRIGGRAWNSK